jgi:lipid-binding SYLF domain-containing protein
MTVKGLTRLGIAWLSVGVLSAGLSYGGESAATRLKTSGDVFTEIMGARDKGIPQELLEDSQCIVIVPGMKKAAFIFGGDYGRGFMLCRQASGLGWSAPAGVKVEGGSVGFQIGGSETDVIMLVMNKRGAEKLLSSQFTLGADASVAAGPVGRTASADRPDEDSNDELYGRKLTNEQIVMGKIKSPASGSKLTAELNRYSARKEAQKD